MSGGTFFVASYSYEKLFFAKRLLSCFTATRFTFCSSNPSLNQISIHICQRAAGEKYYSRRQYATRNFFIFLGN